MFHYSTTAIIFSLLAIIAFSAPVPDFKENFEKIPANFKSLIPQEVKDFIKSLTDEEGKVMQDLAKRWQEFKTEEQSLEALKVKSPSLYEKASKLHEAMQGRIAKLNADAQVFIKKIIQEIRLINAQYLSGETPSLESVKNAAKSHYDQYKALGNDAKDSIVKEFPAFAELASKAEAVVGK